MMPSESILPGQTLGMLGGGQLGRFFVLAARQMGYRVIVLDPDPESPAGVLADHHLCADFDDGSALSILAKSCEAVTTEFENIPASTVAYLAKYTRTYPGTYPIATVQDRIQEKAFLAQHHLPIAPCQPVKQLADIEKCDDALFPGILKISRLGYDGKGQVVVNSREDARAAFLSLGSTACMLEKKLVLDLEISVIFARDHQGQFLSFPVAENHHRQGILDVTIVPARISDGLKAEAIEIAKAVAEGLKYKGLGTVELFVSEGKLYVNEIAPRTHNSGHYTLNACDISQFDLQLRTVCGLPFQSPKLWSDAVMVNLLGDIWPGGHHEYEPDWSIVLNEPQAHLSLYGKKTARKGRKMGHYTVTAPQPDALSIANRLRTALGIDAAFIE